jgi:hypothetical protein
MAAGIRESYEEFHHQLSTSLDGFQRDGPGGASPNRLTTEHYFDLERISGPQISPDGARIVYTRQQCGACLPGCCSSKATTTALVRSLLTSFGRSSTS